MDQRGEAAAEGCGEALDLRLGQALGRGEGAVEFLGDLREAAEAVAFLLGGRGVQGGDGAVDAVEQAVGDGGDKGLATLPRGQVLADFVFGDHGSHGFGDRGGAADEGCDGGEAVGATAGQQAVRGKAAQARDQAKAVGTGGGGEAPDLDRLAQPVAGDRGGEVFERGFVDVGAVAQEGFGEDFGGRDGVHGGPVAGGGPRLAWGWLVWG